MIQTNELGLSMDELRNLIEKKLEDVDSFLDAEKLEEAIEVCNEIISMDDACYMAYSRRGDILFMMGRRLDAFCDLDKLMKLRPECPSAYYVSAKWNLEIGNDRAAIDDANFVIRSGEEYFMNMAYFFRAIALHNLGDQVAAEKDCLLLPDDFRTAITLCKAGWMVLSRDDLHKMITA